MQRYADWITAHAGHSATELRAVARAVPLILDDFDTLLAENARLRAAEAEVERLRAALFPIATGRFASVSEACDLAEDALGSAAVAEWNAVENARAALGEP